MKTDLRATQFRHHRRNIQRYRRLLATPLTDLERQYLHRRIAEEHAELERLEQFHEGASALENQEPSLDDTPPNARPRAPPLRAGLGAEAPGLFTGACQYHPRSNGHLPSRSGCGRQ
jgi:hypothetical protein